MAFTKEREDILNIIADERMMADKIKQITDKYQALLKPLYEAGSNFLKSKQVEIDALKAQMKNEIDALNKKYGR